MRSDAPRLALTREEAGEAVALCPRTLDAAIARFQASAASSTTSIDSGVWLLPAGMPPGRSKERSLVSRHIVCAP